MPDLTVIRGKEIRRIPFTVGQTVSQILSGAGIPLSQPCGGRGVCGKCTVSIRQHADGSPEIQVRACRTEPDADMTIVLPEKTTVRIVTEGNTSVRRGLPMDGRYGAAADIGTTTLALQLYDLETGTCLSQAGCLNPQVSCAADVMGRIGAALDGKLKFLHDTVHTAVRGLCGQACDDAGIAEDEIRSMVVTGNTTMLYLYTGSDPAALAHAPFKADKLFGTICRENGKTVYLPPCMHAFVGADITCAVLAGGQCGNSDISLLCDIGTNGEMALWKDGTLYVTSTAAGPAFEGAGISCGCGSIEGAIDKVSVEDGKIRIRTIGGKPPAGICGSGLIDAVAAGLKTGRIDGTGAMDEDLFPLAEGVALTGADIRAVQMAKAAIAAGIQTLLETAELRAEDVKTLYIAGGFGAHLDTASAVQIGLIPSVLAERSVILGNAALSGAAQMLLDTRCRETAYGIVQNAKHMDLGGNPRFNTHYIDQMMFPEV